MNSHPSTALAARLPPPTLGGRLRRLLFGVAPSETDFARRGFRLTDPAARQRFTVVVDSFLAGYHAAIEDSEPAALAARLSALPNESCGFAYEGAGMGLALLDALTLSERRLRRFLAGPGDPHEYMVYVGVGWAIARLGRRQHRLERHPTLRRYLAADGLGFHEAFFRAATTVDRQAEPRGLRGYARRGYDQGVGRCLWFVEGADPERVIHSLQRFAPERHPDLWAGVGLACTYAGGVPREHLLRVRAAAGPHLPHLAQGSAFAALARGRAGTPSPHSELACQALWGCSAATVAELARAAERDLPPGDAATPDYEVLRARLRDAFTKEHNR